MIGAYTNSLLKVKPLISAITKELNSVSDTNYSISISYETVESLVYIIAVDESGCDYNKHYNLKELEGLTDTEILEDFVEYTKNTIDKRLNNEQF